MARRRFIRTVAAAGAGGALVAEAKVARGDESCDLEAVAIAELSDVGLGNVVDFEYPIGSDSAFIARLGRPALGGVGEDGDIVAFHRACPHMGCRIEEVNVQDGFLGPCGCHRSQFDLSRGGIQVVGRASQNLVQIDLEIIDGTIYAVGVQGLPYGQALTQGYAGEL
ncbi:MAG: arsenate reductase (azurin) small subunit [Myxococcales bacterium]|nr:arsenate reductase (azurin) small subunit [Myxococcales bacterium]